MGFVNVNYNEVRYTNRFVYAKRTAPVPQTMQGPKLLIRGVVVFSVLLVVALYACFWVFHSQLALAQAADSFMDVFTASVLGWTVAVAARPSDEDHPFGHSRAEPIGALVAAVVAGVLAIEVGRSAIMALVGGEQIRLDWLLVVVFGAKTVVKSIVVLLARMIGKRQSSPALDALRVDARNDVLVSLVAIAGFFGARYGMEKLDAILALPVAVWIALAGLRLARENIKLLMGEAPPQARQDELRALAGAVEGVVDAHDLRAHFVGTHLHLQVHVLVNPELSVGKAHDIGEAVRQRLEQEADVAQCFVHIDSE